MPGNPKASPWRSTPRARRHRVAPSWTYPPALIVHVRREAAREGISASELSERCLVAQLGEPPPLPEEDAEPVKKGRPVDDD